MKKINFLSAFTLSLLLLGEGLGMRTSAQGVAINNSSSAANASAMLDVSSTTMGMLIPRMTSAQKTAIASPATGLLVYQTDGSTGFWYYTGVAWTQLGLTGWQLTGNSGTTVGTNYCGTSDGVDFTLGTVGARRMTILGTGNVGYVGIGTTLPKTLLHINAKVIDDNSYTYDGNSLMVIHQTPTSSATLNDPKTVLMLARQGTSGQAYGAAAAFNLSRYENVGVNSRTRLDISLANASFDPTTNNIMTLQSNGYVGIGTTAPTTKLHINAGDLGIGRIDGGDVTPYCRLGLSNGWEQYLANNAYYDAAALNWKFVNTGGYGGTASMLYQISGWMGFYTANGGVNPISWNQRMTIQNNGDVRVNSLASAATQLRVVMADANGTLQTSATQGYSANLQTASVGTDQEITLGTSGGSTGYVDISGASVTFTPVHSTVYVFFSLAGVMDMTVSPYNQSHLWFHILKDGVTKGGGEVFIGDWDDTKGEVTGSNFAISGLPITVTPGTSTTIKAQWQLDNLWKNAGTIHFRCYPVTYPDYSHCFITILD